MLKYKKIRLKAVLAALALVMLITGCNSEKSEEVEEFQGYFLTATSTMLPENRISVDLETNIKGLVQVSMSVSLKPSDGDIYAGSYFGSTEGVKLEGGIGKNTLDISNLPHGDYNVEVVVSPKWLIEEEGRIRLNIDDLIDRHTITTFHLDAPQFELEEHSVK